MWELRLGPWEDGNQYQGAGGGLFKSTDGGKTWHPLTNGLPKGIIQVNLTIALSQASRLYASVASARGETGMGSEVGIYRSDDGGENWQHITTDPRPAGRIGGGETPMPKWTRRIRTSWRHEHGDDEIDGWRKNLIVFRRPVETTIRTCGSINDRTSFAGRGPGRARDREWRASWSTWYNQPTAALSRGHQQLVLHLARRQRRAVRFAFRAAGTTVKLRIATGIPLASSNMDTPRLTR